MLLYFFSPYLRRSDSSSKLKSVVWGDDDEEDNDMDADDADDGADGGDADEDAEDEDDYNEESGAYIFFLIFMFSCHY